MIPEERHALELRDWPEDFDGENGKYSNNCVYCGHQFLGYKRRVVCKFCAAAHSAAAVAEALERAAQIAHEDACFATAAAIRALKPRSDNEPLPD